MQKKLRIKAFAIIAIITISASTGYLTARFRAYHLYTTSENTSSILLKQLIEKDYPEIADPNIKDDHKVNLLRQWAYENIDYAIDDYLDDNPNFQFYSQSAPTLMAAFLNDKSGVICGGNAHTLKKLYNLYGYESYTVDSGKPGIFTHVITLVAIDSNGQKIYSLQDPTYNITFVNVENKPYDYLEFLKTLKQNQHEKIFTSTLLAKKPTKNKDLIISPKGNLQKTLPRFQRFISENPAAPIKINNDRLKYEFIETFDHLNETYLKKTSDFLAQEGHPTDIKYFFLYPISISDSPGHDLLNQARKITNHD